MTLYKKQIQPMVDGPCLQGFNNDYYPLFDKDIWFDEEYLTEEVRKEWEKLVKKKDSWATLDIKERYIEYKE